MYNLLQNTAKAVTNSISLKDAIFVGSTDKNY